MQEPARKPTAPGSLHRSPSLASPPDPFPSARTPLTGLAHSAAPQDGQVDLEGSALLPAARAGFPEHRGHGDAAERDTGPGLRAPSSVPARRGPRERVAASLALAAPAASASRAPRLAGSFPAARPDRAGRRGRGSPAGGAARAPPNSLKGLRRPLRAERISGRLRPPGPCWTSRAGRRRHPSERPQDPAGKDKYRREGGQG